MTPLEWPDDRSVYWWMKAQTGKRTTTIVVGRLIYKFGTEYFQPYQYRDAFSRSICEGWDARFLPGEAPPEFS